MPFWLKAISCSKSTLLPRVVSACFCCSFASRVRRCFMPRKGWRTVQVPDGWLQELRGPRPPSVKWSKAVPQSKSAASPSHSRPGPVGGPPPLRHTSKPPEQVAADVVGEIERLKAAIPALGDSGARESTQGSPSSCPSTCFRASSGGAGGIVQAFLGTCQEACGAGSSCCRQGSRAGSGLRG